MNEAKLQMDVLPAEDIAELAQVAPPLAATAAMRLQSRLRLADRVNLPTNVVISNVPGPRNALYFAGAKMTNYIPVSTIADDMGLNITVHSYLDRLDFGLIADRELVPDLWDLVDLHIDEIAVLFEATGAEWAEEQKAPSMRRGGARKAPAARSRRDEEDTGQEDPTTKKSPASKKSAAKKSPARRSRRRTEAAGRFRDPERPNLTASAPTGKTRRRWTSTCHPTTTRRAARCATGSPQNPRPTAKQLAEAGYVVPHWPKPWGLEADPIDQLVIDDELAKAGIQRPGNHIGIGWAAPTIFLAGTPEQHERYLPTIFSGEEIWCQLFSEPDAGSDLANLATRAVRDGDEYVVNGSKIWSSGAHHSQLGILIARTDPDQPKHKGISYFICPMDLPGISMSPIVDMTTAHSFNQVFFDNVRIPASLRVGEEGDGWRLAKVTLSNERVSLSSAGSLWGVGPSADDLIDLIRDNGGLSDPVLRDRAVRLHIEAEAAAPQPDAQLERPAEGQDPRTRSVDPEDHGRRARPARDGARQGRRRRRRHAHRLRPERDDRVVVAQRTDREQARRRSAVPRRRAGVALRLPVQPGAHARRWHVRRAAQHRRRVRARAATRAEPRAGPHLVRGAPAAKPDATASRR